ncbi:MAG: helix-turn-helix domain-containing protein [Eubacterium sp.]|nr:helix-turn-helix domain-containing protein [Eubacterium sp.]
MRLGIVIQNYRKEHNISMDDFASKSGISKSYVGFLEQGRHPKTGNKIYPSIDIIGRAATAMDMDFDTLFNMIDEDITVNTGESRMYLLSNQSTSVKIPVLGRVAAGTPIDAIEEIIDYIDVSEDMAASGELFGLRIKGNSMDPFICNGDTVVVIKTNVAESGDIVIAAVSEEDAVCKKYVKRGRSIKLQSLNPDYEDINVTGNPDFRIIGVVTELRRQLKKK